MSTSTSQQRVVPREERVRTVIVGFVGPCSLLDQASSSPENVTLFRRILVGILHPQPVTLLETRIAHCSLLSSFVECFVATKYLVVASNDVPLMLLESLETQDVVRVVQAIAVKVVGDTLRIVIRPVDLNWILASVQADQQRAAWLEKGRKSAQKGCSLVPG